MRPWVRCHLTYANVMATLAVFLVLGGGTALGAYVVSSNGQIGPGTISGHRPPAGDHPNIIAASVSAGDIAPQQGWHALAFTPATSWTAYGGGYNPPDYFKDDLGIVHLRGLVKNANGFGLSGGCFYDNGAQQAGVMFILPAGYRPRNEEIFADDNTDGFGRIDVLPSGVVCAMTSTPANGFASLDGITFRAVP